MKHIISVVQFNNVDKTLRLLKIYLHQLEVTVLLCKAFCEFILTGNKTVYCYFSSNTEVFPKPPTHKHRMGPVAVNTRETTGLDTSINLLGAIVTF